MKSILPFTRDGRQTLIYLVLAGCGPALTFVVFWSMRVIQAFPGASAEQRLEKYANLAMLVGSALIIIVIALSCFVSIRAIKVGKDGIEAQGDGGGA